MPENGPFPAVSVPVGNPLEPAPPATAELHTSQPASPAYLVVDRDGDPTWDSRVHDTRDAAEAAASAANAYFFNVEQPVYVVVTAPPAATYFAAEQARSQAWIRRHLDTIERLRTLVDAPGQRGRARVPRLLGR